MDSNKMTSGPGYALSSEDLRKISPDIRIVLYSDIYKYSSLEQLFQSGGNRPIALLYEIQPKYGHWTLLIRHNPGNYEFFDSYGLKPDSELKFIDKGFRSQSDQDHSYLLDFINKASQGGADTTYSKKAMQSSNPSIATCGRWIALRARFSNIPLKEFRQILSSTDYSPDKIVTGITNMFLRR